MLHFFNNMRLKVAVILVLFSAVSVLSRRFQGPGIVSTNCCTKVSRRLIPFQVTHYRIQPELSPCVEAIIFYTVKKGPLCADPKARWVSRKIKEINARMQSDGANVN
ncbi:eotaxin-like [Carcharodon carcharias]|uniref:eotaxin-like n=1 Tax=Carcharodon carcharias TaxID=13397 RepID=UPI001B7D923C|nr:eotaxin-like [Carcharodon carcharias]